jgi:hypothetical protein
MGARIGGRTWQGARAYAESKLCDVLLAFAVARRQPPTPRLHELGFSAQASWSKMSPSTYAAK